MFKRILSFAIFLILLFASGALSGERSLTFPLFFVLLSILLLYFYFEEDFVSTFLAASLLVIHLFVKVFLSGQWNYLWLMTILFFIGLFASYDYFLWRSQVRLSLEKRDRSSDEIQKLKERFESKEESVKRLEQQVADILRLFEIAKEFNECLAFEDLMDVLVHKVLPDVPFSSSTLIVLNEKQSAQTAYRMGVRVEGMQVTSDIVENSMEARLAHYLIKHQTPLRWDTATDISENFGLTSDTEFPFWVFPLFIQEKMIAAFVVEHANPQDWPKFEIVSAQLAMQVNKIRLYETVKELSIVDGLTQVFVRRHFLERFSEELKRGIKHRYPLCVLMLDIDHFKTYNDKYGHLVGDMTLKEVASLIREAVRRVDIIARYGGEEFVIVLPETSKKAGLEVSERIRSTVAKKKFRVYDEETQVTVSIGVSVFPEDLAKEPSQEAVEMEMLELLTRADQALYKAKEEGRNRVILYSHL